MIKPNDLGLPLGKLFEHPIDLFGGGDGLDLARGVTERSRDGRWRDRARPPAAA